MAPDTITSDEVALTAGDHMRAYYLGQSPLFRTMMALVAFGLVFVLWLDSLNDEPDYLMDFLFALAVAFVLLVPLYTQWRMRPDQVRLVYTIDRDKLVMTDRTGTALTMPWSQISLVQEYDRGFRVVLSPGYRWFVKRAFSRAALAAFRALARDKLGDKAKLK